MSCLLIKNKLTLIHLKGMRILIFALFLCGCAATPKTQPASLSYAQKMIDHLRPEISTKGQYIMSEGCSKDKKEQEFVAEKLILLGSKSSYGSLHDYLSGRRITQTYLNIISSQDSEQIRKEMFNYFQDLSIQHFSSFMNSIDLDSCVNANYIAYFYQLGQYYSLVISDKDSFLLGIKEECNQHLSKNVCDEIIQEQSILSKEIEIIEKKKFEDTKEDLQSQLVDNFT